VRTETSVSDTRTKQRDVDAIGSANDIVLKSHNRREGWWKSRACISELCVVNGIEGGVTILLRLFINGSIAPLERLNVEVF
jgi:hypothetical protein